MIPRLYEGNETEFASLGIGELADTTSCKVTEERNGSFELELEYPESGKLFDEITAGRIILAKPSDTAQAQPFKIYSISKPLSGTITVNAEHISYLLSGIPVKPFKATGINAALAGIKSNAMVNCPFEFWTDISNGSSPYSVTEPKSARACLVGTEGSILDAFGGEFEWDRWTVKSYLHRGSDSGVTIEYGKNLTDLKQDESIEELYTGCIAYWKPSQEGETVTGEVQYIDNHSNYPHERIFIYDASSDYQEAPTADQLNARAAKYITDNSLGTPKVNLTISFVALWQTEEYKSIAPLERVSLCDTVHVNYPKLGVTASAKVIKTTYDTLMERYDSIELGDAKSSMADTIKQSMGITGSASSMIKKSSSFLESAISAATTLIQGGLGGYVVIGTNADGEPNEILVMDTDDKTTAVNVIRINENGIGFSKNGYNGPFTTAWTIDGKFNADFITSGIINANLIKAGVIQDTKSSNWWNLESGEVHISAVDSLGKLLSDAKSEWQQTANGISQTVSSNYERTVTGQREEFAQGDSDTTAPADGWSTTQPERKDGTYIWRRTVTTFGDGTTSTSPGVCITGPKGDTGTSGAAGATGPQGPTGAQGADGSDALAMAITSDNGTTFKNTSGTTVLTAHVFRRGAELSDEEIAMIGLIQWYKDGSAVGTGKTLSVTASSVNSTSVYRARLEA